METGQILTSSGAGLSAAIREGVVSSREVVTAHIDRVREVEPALNALIFDRFDAALAEADAADARVADAREQGNTEDLPPLLGVPCTVKESFALIGMPQSAGVVHRKDIRSDENAPPVQRMIDAGAIPLGVTNIPELTLWIESDNRIYGRANNAYDHSRTAGGSSGGEGAIIGVGASPFGIGSDLAGSIRAPAFFNGIFGHKPTHGLIPSTGQWPHASGSTARMLTAGPMARRAEDLMPLLKITAGPDGVDENVEPAELGDPASVSLEGLDVIILKGASFIPASRELRDTRERAAGALIAAGARVRTVPMRSMLRALHLFTVAAANGGGASILEMLSPEGGPPATLREVVRERKALHTTPVIWEMLGEELLGGGSPRMTQRLIAAGESLADEFNALVGDGVVLHVPHSHVAPKHGSTVARPWAVQPTAIFNLTRSPATQVPLGLNQRGLPLGVQVVGARGNDHVTIAVAQELERAFGGWTPPVGLGRGN